MKIQIIRAAALLMLLTLLTGCVPAGPAETDPAPTETSSATEATVQPTETEPKPTETEPVPTETEPVPTETEPAPTETEPKPTETEPVPTETEPVPTETEPAPTETEPKPTETEPVPTETEPVPTETEPKPTETEPPKTEPPAPDNDVGKPLAKDEFTLTVTEVKQSGNQYIVCLTLHYSGEQAHELSARERFFLVNAERRTLKVDDILDGNGVSIMGSSIVAGQTLTIQAVFTLTDGFAPVAFRYVYDIMGFRRIQAEL